MLASGQALAGFGLTEPEAGSDAGGTKTTARRETVGDKYGRQMDLSSEEIDLLLKERSLAKLRTKLIDKFPRWEEVIVEAIRAIVVSTPP